MKALRIAVAAAVLAAATTANAHHLWIEQAGTDTLLRFGEFAENARERSPGRLDAIRHRATLTVQQAGGPETFAISN